MSNINPLHRVERLFAGIMETLDKLIPAQAMAVAAGRDFDAAATKAEQALVDAEAEQEVSEPRNEFLGPYTPPQTYEHIRPLFSARSQHVDRQLIEDMKRDVAANQKHWGDLGRLIHVQYVYEIIDQYLVPNTTIDPVG